MAGLLLTLLVALSVSAQTTTLPLNTDAQEYVYAHNQARAEVGVGHMTWTDNLAKAASLLVRYRDKINCSFAKLAGNKYGGNQLQTVSLVGTTEAVGEWVKEKSYYIHSNNTCIVGHETCGVYTQVVWRKSVELGCPQTSCSKEGYYMFL